MNAVIAGLATGTLMAQTFIVLWCVTAFFIIKDPPSAFSPVLHRFAPGTLVLAVVASAFPIWGIVGVILGFLFLALENGLPGAGPGTPNLAYSIGVSTASVALALPFAVGIRRIWPSMAATAVASVFIFGWLLPFLAT